MKIKSKGNGLIIDDMPWARDVTKLGRGKYADIISDSGHRTSTAKAPTKAKKDSTDVSKKSAVEEL